MKNRILSIDLLRGFGIMVIIVIHRLHYHWTGMRSTEILKEHFSSAWAPLLITVIALFTMAGIFYFISGIVNAFSFYKNIVEKKISSKKVMLGGLAGGLWIFILNYIHKLFFSNGFVVNPDGAEPEYPIGFLVGLIRNSTEVTFYPSQVTEPGTLAVIGLVVMVISLTMGILLNPKFSIPLKTIIHALLIFTFVALLLSPILKFYLRPLYEQLYTNRKFFQAFITGLVCQEFSLSPYLGYGFMGALIGITLASKENYTTFRSRNMIALIALMILGLICIVLFDKEKTFQSWVVGSGIAYFELGLFILFLMILLRKVDHINLKNEKTNKYKFITIRSFGMVALTVYFFEPLVAEVFITIIDLFAGKNWHNQIEFILLFGLFLLGFWTLILHFWKKINFAGSLEWLSVKLLFLVAKKRSNKTEFSSIK